MAGWRRFSMSSNETTFFTKKNKKTKQNNKQAKQQQQQQQAACQTGKMGMAALLALGAFLGAESKHARVHACPTRVKRDPVAHCLVVLFCTHGFVCALARNGCRGVRRSIAESPMSRSNASDTQCVLSHNKDKEHVHVCVCVRGVCVCEECVWVRCTHERCWDSQPNQGQEHNTITQATPANTQS